MLPTLQCLLTCYLQSQASVSSLLMQKTQIHSLQENFTDYLLSWLHSSYKAPQTYCERTWLTLHRAPLQHHPPGASSTSSASKTGLPAPLTDRIQSRSFHPSSPTPPQVDLLEAIISPYSGLSIAHHCLTTSHYVIVCVGSASDMKNTVGLIDFQVPSFSRSVLCI
ncbi:hypothetical protein AMECASPLE_024770 [Ameca splendens]|uniref:Uncharacterized protein n=1 Tax=Ameca splendens TaxID=208324 RepID=A0ABV0Z2T5_9TELE